MSDTATDTLARKDKSGATISGGHLVARGLKNEGVDTIFTLCGGHIIDIYDGCLDEGIRIIDVRHEQVAAQREDGVDALVPQGLRDQVAARDDLARPALLRQRIGCRSDAQFRSPGPGSARGSLIAQFK